MAPNLHVSETHAYDETSPSANLLASSSQRDMSILQHISDTNNLYKTTQQSLDSGYEADDSGDSPAILTQSLPEDHNFFSSWATNRHVDNSSSSHNLPDWCSTASNDYTHSRLSDTISDSGVSLSDAHAGSSSESHIVVRRGPRTSRTGKISEVLTSLRKSKLSPLDLIIEIVNTSNTAYDNYRQKMYEESGRRKLISILDMIMDDGRGKSVLLDWMRPHVLQQVHETVHDEMNALTLELCTTMNTITPEYLMVWS